MTGQDEYDEQLIRPIGLHLGTARSQLENATVAPLHVATDLSAVLLIATLREAKDHLDIAIKQVADIAMDAGANAEDVANAAGVGRATVFRWRREHRSTETGKQPGPGTH